MSVKRGILSLKKQHLFENNDEVGDAELSTSYLAAIKAGFNCSPPKDGSQAESDSESDSSSSSSSSSSDSDSATLTDHPVEEPVVVLERLVEVSCPADDASVSPTPTPGPRNRSSTSTVGPTTPAQGPSTAPSPAPGPLGPSSIREDDGLRDPAFEDISIFEPQITSTPRQPQNDGVSDCEVGDVDVNLDLIKTEIRDGKMLQHQIEFDFIRDIRHIIQEQSSKHITKLTNRRIKISKTMAELVAKRKKIDNLLLALNSERDEIDNAVHKVKYFTDHFPY